MTLASVGFGWYATAAPLQERIPERAGETKGVKQGQQTDETIPWAHRKDVPE